MKIWIGLVVVAILSLRLFGFDPNNFLRTETPEEKQNKIDALRWEKLCAETECENFPENHVTFVMTNGITLFMKKRRCCGTEERSFYDPEFNRHVIFDAEQVYFDDEDFKEIGIFKYKWSSHALMYFTSSKNILYGSSRELILGINLNIPYEFDLDPNRSFDSLRNSNFSIMHHNVKNPRVFSIITSKSIFFDHRISISCRSLCRIISYDFEEGPGKTGIHVHKLIGLTLPRLPENCVNNIPLKNCSEFSLNEEVYFDFLRNIENLYKFFQIHPDKRSGDI